MFALAICLQGFVTLDDWGCHRRLERRYADYLFLLPSSLFPGQAHWKFGWLKIYSAVRLVVLVITRIAFILFFILFVSFCPVVTLPWFLTLNVANQHLNISLEYKLGIGGYYNDQNKALNKSKSLTHHTFDSRVIHCL